MLLLSSGELGVCRVLQTVPILTTNCWMTPYQLKSYTTKAVQYWTTRISTFAIVECIVHTISCCNIHYNTHMHFTLYNLITKQHLQRELKSWMASLTGSFTKASFPRSTILFYFVLFSTLVTLVMASRHAWSMLGTGRGVLHKNIYFKNNNRLTCLKRRGNKCRSQATYHLNHMHQYNISVYDNKW